ncbi:murein biosynthesis integral membrane protein MurJ [Serinicoccus kebangsaanensis]|uniref:murein biosynthesis integral membrane protein MurJ n=1 Tax=Serinicoccus kebangsaanensis TaxID=2602069 RepID=UPI00124DEC58|nr:lipid II flippase MurJ [Serinicoccus kebangsaanensis]
MGPTVSDHGPSARLLGQGLLAAAGVVAVTTLLARVAGLARWLAFSEAVGTTCVGQIYVTVNQVPNVLFEVAAGGALAAVAVPLVSRRLQQGQDDLADRTASALLSWTLLILLPLTLLVASLAGPVSAALLSTSDDLACAPEDVARTGRLMLLLFAPQILLYGIGIVLSGVLQAHRRFLAAAVAPLLSSVVVIAVYLLFGATVDPQAPLGELSGQALVLLAGGTTLGVVALSLPLVLPTLRAGVRWRPTLRFPDGTGRIAGALALAGLVTVGAQQVFTVVVLLVANSTGVGGVTVWTYAQTIYLLPYAVLVVPLATAAFPRLTGEPAAARRTLRRTALGITVSAVAGAAALVAARREVGTVFLVLDAGADGAGREALSALPWALAALAPGLVGFALLALLTRALYAVHRPGPAAAGAGAGWLVAALVAVLGAGPAAAEGVSGVLLLLALSSSAGMLLSGLVLVVLTRRAWGPSSLQGLGRSLLVAVAGAAVAVTLAELLPLHPEGMGGAILVGALRGLTGMAGVAALVAALDRDSWALVRARLLRRRGGG